MESKETKKGGMEDGCKCRNDASCKGKTHLKGERKGILNEILLLWMILYDIFKTGCGEETGYGN